MWRAEPAFELDRRGAGTHENSTRVASQQTSCRLAVERHLQLACSRALHPANKHDAARRRHVHLEPSAKP